MKKQRILRQTTLPCQKGDPDDALTEACREFDVPKPLWLGKQEREYEEFRQTAFIQDNFLEEIDFDRLEIEFIDDSKKKKNDLY